MSSNQSVPASTSHSSENHFSGLIQFHESQPDKSLREYLVEIQADALSTESLLDLACADIFQRLNRGSAIRTENYLHDFPQLSRTELLLELLDAELCALFALGKLPDLVSLVSRFPEHAEQVARMHQLCELEHQTSVGIRPAVARPPFVPSGLRIVDRGPGSSCWLARPVGPRNEDSDNQLVMARNWNGFVDGLLEVHFSLPIDGARLQECDCEQIAELSSLLVSFRHPAFSTVYEIGESNRVCFLTTSHHAGISLESRYSKELTFAWVESILTQAAFAVEAARLAGLAIFCNPAENLRVRLDDRLTISPGVPDYLFDRTVRQLILDLSPARQIQQLQSFGELAGRMLSEACCAVDNGSRRFQYWNLIAERCMGSGRESFRNWSELLDAIERQPD